MKTQLLVTGSIALAASMMMLAPAVAQGGPDGGYGPPPGGPGGMMPPPGGPGGPGHGPGPFGPSPDQLDPNQDGKITSDEYNAAWDKVIQEQFKKLDTNSDGSLNKQELEKVHGPGRAPRDNAQDPGELAGPPPPPPPPGGMNGARRPPMRPARPTAEQLDPNKDGTVTRDEYALAWVKVVQQQFTDIDTSKDGSLSKDEMNKARGPEPGQRGPGGPFGPGDGPPLR